MSSGYRLHKDIPSKINGEKTLAELQPQLLPSCLGRCRTKDHAKSISISDPNQVKEAAALATMPEPLSKQPLHLLP